MILYSERKFDILLAKVQHLLLDFPDSSRVYNIQGAANAALMRSEASLLSFKKALCIQPSLADGYNNIGNSFQSEKVFSQAITNYNKAIKIAPGYSVAYSNTAKVLKEKEEFDKASNFFIKTLILEPNNDNAYFSLATMLQGQGRTESARLLFIKTIYIRPIDAETFNRLGIILKEQGKMTEAVETYKNALLLEPKWRHLWDNIFIPLKVISKKEGITATFLSGLGPSINSHDLEISRLLLNFRLKLGGEGAKKALKQVIGAFRKSRELIINKEPVNIIEPLEKINSSQVVALVHFGRSGTGLLHSLVDGHPNVITLPSIYFSEYFGHSAWKKMKSDGWSKIKNRFASIYNVLFDASSDNAVFGGNTDFTKGIGKKEGLTAVGNNRNEVLGLDKERFLKELSSLMDCEEKLDAFDFFGLVQRAYSITINDKNKKSHIFYHIHNPSTYAQINFASFAPAAKWLMMVREPIQSCESWCRDSFKKSSYDEIIVKISKMLLEIDNVIYSKKNTIGIRLEDLKSCPKKTVPALCEWMGIAENECLYKMTVQGKKWWGDPSSPDYEKDGMNPFGKTSINRKTGQIFSERDQFILRTLFYPFNVNFGYVEQNDEQFKVNLKEIRPMLNALFDFERQMINNSGKNLKEFLQSGSYLYFRLVLMQRWETLDKYDTYPNMIKRLHVN